MRTHKQKKQYVPFRLWNVTIKKSYYAFLTITVFSTFLILPWFLEYQELLKISLYTLVFNISLFIIIYIINKLIVWFGHNSLIYLLQRWIDNYYGVQLSTSQIRTFLEPESVFEKPYISKSLKMWDDHDGQKHLTKIVLVKKKDELILLNLMTGMEIPSRSEKEEHTFFNTMWEEVIKNGGFYSYGNIDELENPQFQKSRSSNTTILFWSDSLRAQLYSEKTDEEIIFIPLPVFVQIVLPKISLNKENIGLNWGEEERTFAPQRIQEFIS